MQKNSVFANVDDSELVSLAQQGNDEAFSELVTRHRTTCSKLAMSILRNREDADDEVQNAIWKAYQHIGRFKQEARFSTWLTRIVVNQCLMQIRKNRRAKLFYIDDVMIGEENGTMELPDDSMNPEDVLAGAEVTQALRKEIRRIPPLMRDVVVMREVQQLPMPEVAERLGISVAAAKSRLLRARQELRSRMEKHTGRLGPVSLFAKA